MDGVRLRHRSFLFATNACRKNKQIARSLGRTFLHYSLRWQNIHLLRDAAMKIKCLQQPLKTAPWKLDLKHVLNACNKESNKRECAYGCVIHFASIETWQSKARREMIPWLRSRYGGGSVSISLPSMAALSRIPAPAL
ncbi:hypothetical protein [Rhodoblastus sp.]|uniref:hypothetical protein n=1 Tax=Rhodoblastus sp. TaxID=1962975 RepID=UPI003F9A3ED0